jgi:hypothetical protein
LAAEVAAEFEGMFSANPGNGIGDLENIFVNVLGQPL